VDHPRPRKKRKTLYQPRGQGRMLAGGRKALKRNKIKLLKQGGYGARGLYGELSSIQHGGYFTKYSKW